MALSPTFQTGSKTKLKRVAEYCGFEWGKDITAQFKSEVASAEASRTLAGLRDSAMIRLMSDCLLRISEAVAVNIEDVKESTLAIHSSKTDQEGKGVALFVGEPTLKAIEKYRAEGGIDTGALFRRIRRGGHATPTHPRTQEIP